MIKFNSHNKKTNAFQNPLLLGEAPKGKTSKAFNAESWTAMRLAESLGVLPNNLKKYFGLKNLLDEAQVKCKNGFDKFNQKQAVNNIEHKLNGAKRVICVGWRVTKALAKFFGWSNEEIKTYVPLYGWGKPFMGLQFARIPHPANRQGRNRYHTGKKVLTNQCVEFLIKTIRIRYPNSFAHRLKLN